jgi:hypothetical protein
MDDVSAETHDCMEAGGRVMQEQLREENNSSKADYIKKKITK